MTSSSGARGSAASVRIGNCSGFYGDRHSAMREMLVGGELDYVTGDYLAELTMLILGRDRMKHPERGYAKTFLTQLEECLGLASDRGVRIVANAGGLNPAGLADAVRALAERLGVPVRVAHVDGDDLSPRAEELGLGKPLTANAYLGAWGIVDCLNDGADIVVTGRVTDASVTVGPAAAHFGWQRTDYDRLAGAVVAGHVIECGIQATGGNFSFFTEIPDLTYAGFPLAEVHADGSSVITKHPGTGGLVSVDTVTAQLLYEITGARYANPDVTARMDTIELSDDGPDRVRISGVTGEPPPPTLKVSLNSIGGFRNAMTFVLTGLDIEAKADLVRRQLDSALSVKPAELEWTLARTDHADADTEEAASALLRCVVRDPDPANVGRQFSSAAVELALASYPGFTVTAPPGDGQVYGVYTPGYVDAAKVQHVAVHADGTRIEIPCATDTLELQPADAPPLPEPLPAGTDTAGAAWPHRRRAQRRQGRVGQRRGVGPHRRAVALAGQHPHRRAAQAAASRNRRPAGHPAPAAQPARGELRHRGDPRPGRRLSGALRSAGQRAGRMAAQPPCRHSGSVAVREGLL